MNIGVGIPVVTGLTGFIVIICNVIFGKCILFRSLVGFIRV